MEIHSLIQEAPGSAPFIAQREEHGNAEQRRTAEAARDTISISPEARERLRAQESGETGDRANHQAGEKNAANGMAHAGEGEDAPESKVQKLQKQIRDLKKRIAELNARLAEAQNDARQEAKGAAPADAGQDARSSDGQNAAGGKENEAESAAMATATASALGGGSAQAEARTIQAQLSQMHQQLMELYQQLQTAMTAESGA